MKIPLIVFIFSNFSLTIFNVISFKLCIIKSLSASLFKMRKGGLKSAQIILYFPVIPFSANLSKSLINFSSFFIIKIII
jgi:hypothetical protein